MKRERINRYSPGIISNIKDWICDTFGHRQVWGPRRGDGQTICVFCNTHLGFRKFGLFEDLAKKMNSFNKKVNQSGE